MSTISRCCSMFYYPALLLLLYRNCYGGLWYGPLQLIPCQTRSIEASCFTFSEGLPQLSMLGLIAHSMNTKLIQYQFVISMTECTYRLFSMENSLQLTFRNQCYKPAKALNVWLWQFLSAFHFLFHSLAYLQRAEFLCLSIDINGISAFSARAQGTQFA